MKEPTNKSDIRSIEWRGDHLRILDQTFLPSREIYTSISSTGQVWEAIRQLRVRGAPAIGVAAAYGLYMGAKEIPDSRFESFYLEAERLSKYLAGSAPAVINLQWALDRLLVTLKANSEKKSSELKNILLETAKTIHEEDIRNCEAIGRYGAEVVGRKSRILTHSNTGHLATSGCGTAHSVLQQAHASGRLEKVWVGETRPLLQGSRLTAWELNKTGIPYTLIADSTAGFLMQQEKVDLVIVGADRIAANGDTANRTGTYSLAVLAAAHDIPFYVAAPFSSIDFCKAEGADVPMEERGADEITHIGGALTTPRKSDVCNPAFDITPHHLITGFITEKGIIRPDYMENLKRTGENLKVA